MPNFTGQAAIVFINMTCFNKAFLLIATLLVLAGCGEKDRRNINTNGIEITMPVIRLEEELFACRTEDEVLAFLNNHPSVADLYFPDATSDRPELAAKLFQNISNPALRGFKGQLDSLFSDFDQSVAEPLRNAFKHLNYYYPDAPIPEVRTMITGFLGADLLITDSLIIIGLDYFGGPNARFRPDVHHYQLSRYEKHYIAPSVLFFKAQTYNRLDPADRSLLADMIWYGKNYEFVRYMMPQTPDSLILGLSQENLSKAEVSQKDIWAHLMANKLLYEYVEQKKQKYVGERPVTYEIGEDVPGGIGRWVGWKIVNRLLRENPEESLPDLMENQNAKAILEASGYRGQRDY